MDMVRYLVLLILLGIPAQSALTVKDAAGSTLTSMTFSARQGGPQEWRGIYLAGGAAAWSSSYTAGSGAQIDVQSSQATCTGTPSKSCTGGTYAGILQVSFNRDSNLGAGTYTATIRVTDGTTTVDVAISITIVAQSWNTTYSYQTSYPVDCAVSNANNFPYSDQCTDSTWRPTSTSFTVPSVGLTYTDHNFGKTVRVAADQAAHNYSSQSALNADGTKARVYQAGHVRVIDTSSGTVVVEDAPQSGNCFFWDPTDPAVSYHCPVANKKLVKSTYNYVAGTWTETDVVNLATDMPSGYPENGMTGDPSANGWMALTSTGDAKVCAIRLSDGYTTCALTSGLPGPAFSVDFAQIGKGVEVSNGKQYILASPAYGVGAFALYSFKPGDASPALVFEHRGPKVYAHATTLDYWYAYTCLTGATCLKGEHGDTYQDPDGHQYFVQSLDVTGMNTAGNYATRQMVVAYRLDAGEALMGKPTEIGGGMTYVRTIAAVAPYSVTHFGCAKTAAYCVFETYGCAMTAGYCTSDNINSWIVSGATNATPIVLTTSTAHSLTNGAMVNVGMVGGNSAANGILYAMTTGYDSTHLALYSDAGLTTPVAGNGVYTSGGVVGWAATILARSSGEELSVFQLGSAPRMWRMARTRTTKYTNDWALGYDAQPHACLSADGSTLLWKGNMGEPGHNRVMVLATGLGGSSTTSLTGTVRMQGTGRVVLP